MKSFDVQVRRGGRWATDSTYDDRELAELRARQHEATGTLDPVRVTQEVFVEKTQKYVRRTVYRDAKFQETVQSKIDNSRAASDRSKSARETPMKKGSNRQPNRQRTPPAKKATLSLYWISGFFTLIGGLGIGSMIALEHFR